MSEERPRTPQGKWTNQQGLKHAPSATRREPMLLAHWQWDIEVPPAAREVDQM